MPTLPSSDKYFSGSVKASLPSVLLGEGDVRRLINSKFIEGAITNGIAFDKFEITYSEGNDKYVYLSNATYGDILNRGDVQLVAPLETPSGKYIVAVISGILFRIDLETCIATDITPTDALLPDSSMSQPLSYLTNDGGVSGVGGTLVIYNYNNRPIFVTDRSSRLSDPADYEMPPARFGVSAGTRIINISGRNTLWASDPFGGGNPNAPLTFEETLKPAADYYGQIGKLGNSLGDEFVTGICRLPKYLGPSQDFLAHSVYVTTRNHHYIIQASAPRSTWDTIEFVAYAGAFEGFAGPLASTTMGSNIVYINTKGRLRTVTDNQKADSSLTNDSLDENIGQFLCPCEGNFYHRTWYEDLDHSRSIIKYAGERLYFTAYPFYTKAINKAGREVKAISHRALGIGNRGGLSTLGPEAILSWEGFNDNINPTAIITYTDDTVLVVSKNEYGKIEFFRNNLRNLTTKTSTIYTRGHFSNDKPNKGLTLKRGSIYFRQQLNKDMNIVVSYLANGTWIQGSTCSIDGNLAKFSIERPTKTFDSSIPLKIDIDHKGCRFEVASIELSGEVAMDN